MIFSQKGVSLKVRHPHILNKFEDCATVQNFLNIVHSNN